ncbi:aromatic-ring-hydroxylating dioxygenase subunit beta (plasmid) [Pseudomonas sp. App30]|uniref:aromatic-ring-hydroxylating dioxygenase subunit beta n=1 Tax=Pseudomonas sp. App30 TaxID=3068990 RepID=UPI003A80F630
MQHNQTDTQAIEALIYQEIALLDEQDYDNWQSLLTADFTYWIPLRREQQSPLLESSLLYEDHFLTRLRVARLANARNFSQQPKSRSQHIAQKPQIECDSGAGHACVTTSMLYCEARGDSEWQFPVKAIHQLKRVEDNWKISAKKILLLNPSRALESLQLII